jgi:putative ABC transport system permease protein
LIFILSSLALGLANQNTAAVYSWRASEYAISKDADGNMTQSLLTKNDVEQAKSSGKTATIGVVPTTMKYASKRATIEFIGLNFDEFVGQRLELTSGRLPQNDHEVVISADERVTVNKLTAANYPAGSKVKIGLSSATYKVVGYVKNAIFNVYPVVYGRLNQWQAVRGLSGQFVGSGVLTTGTFNTTRGTNLETFSEDKFVNNLPGYSAQKTTFVLMIGFLVVISLVVITIFLYILTIQKVPNLAVLRAQGIPSGFLIKNTFFETLVIMVTAVVLGLVLTAGTAAIIPPAVPMWFDALLTVMVAIGIVVTGLIGAIIPIRIIAKIDPVSVIGG